MDTVDKPRYDTEQVFSIHVGVGNVYTT
ncbi:MAG TPA: hypothetical protein LFW21_06795 [Rickettsia endosymbiont of Pyrocoelia pectoralis]|nr:hypothetical protein [Rickettsia endosymbiont of Pyrocoelia pectoralis]